jgi:hypothetical protein
MPRTTGTIQRALPTSAPARVVNQQPRSGFKPPSPPQRRVMNATPQARPAANFSVPAARMSLSQAVSQTAVNPITFNPVTTAANNCCCAACTGLQCLDRTRFFSGQLLTDADLNNEQSYLLAKNRLHNRYLHGYGVVCGLQVTCGECPGWVNISPGYAIDPCGNDIIVCTAQSFNVLQAIQNCCTPAAQTSNCGPVRNVPPPTCQQQTQTWCITIQYQEQQTNMVTPLQSVSSSSGCGCGTTSCVCGGCASGNKMSSSGCGCGGSKSSSSGCGCGCQGSSSGGCSCSSCAASTTSSSAAACQATRILEGFQLGVCQQQATLSYKVSPVPGALTNTIVAEPFAGYQALSNLVKSKPTFVNNGVATMSNSQVYTAASQYLTSAQNLYFNAGLQNCQGYADLNGIAIAPPPPQTNDATYALAQQTNVNTIYTNVGNRGFELLCAAMMPPCPPVACDTRLILACVTVCNGNIMNVCQFGGGRKLLVGFPTIAYWLSLVWPSFSEDFGEALEKLCCDESQLARAVFNSDTYPRAVLSGSTGTPDIFNRAVASYAGQIMGSAFVNAVSPATAANTVDLRPLVNLAWSQVAGALSSYSTLIEPGTTTATNNVTFSDVSVDPSWTDDAIASAGSYAPAAFQTTNPVTQGANPLTIYYRGGTKVNAAAANTTPKVNAIAGVNQLPQDAVVVGFAVTSPTDYLSNQITALQNQIGTLQNQITALQTPPTTPPAAAPTPTQPTPPPVPPAESVDASVKPGKKK